MHDSDAQKIIRLLEEIRDAQRLQLERQAILLLAFIVWMLFARLAG